MDKLLQELRSEKGGVGWSQIYKAIAEAGKPTCVILSPDDFDLFEQSGIINVSDNIMHNENERYFIFGGTKFLSYFKDREEKVQDLRTRVPSTGEGN